MMALESSVLGCGSDDWSVDSDYAFQDFADDIKNHNSERLQQSSPERSPSFPGTQSSSTHAVGNPINDLKGSVCNVREHSETAAEKAAVTTSPAEGGGGMGGSVVLPGKVTWAARESREDSPAGSGRDDPCMSETRLFGDPGSSTDSAHILRLEQRMFLKVGPLAILTLRLGRFHAMVKSANRAGSNVT